jgi:AraC-like DNA-binding protein/mannose-6-phosphate isomerase-like protein (cupin superfamily)
MDVYLRLNDKRRSHLCTFPVEGNLYYPSIIHCGLQEHESIKATPLRPHEHGVYHLLLFLEGNTDFISGGRSVPAARGLFVISSPGDRHSFLPHLPGRVKYIELTFEYISLERRLNKSFEEILSCLLNTVVESKTFYMLDEEKIEFFKSLHSRLYYRLSLEENYQVDLILLEIFLFIRDMMGLINRLVEIQKDKRKNRASQIKEMIHSRFPAKFNFNEISSELGISKSYLIKKFKEEYACTPLEYDRKLRINAAADLIISTNRTLEDIAFSLGFCDVFYFIKTFKKYKGVTPGKYR